MASFCDTENELSVLPCVNNSVSPLIEDKAIKQTDEKKANISVQTVPQEKKYSFLFDSPPPPVLLTRQLIPINDKFDMTVDAKLTEGNKILTAQNPADVVLQAMTASSLANLTSPILLSQQFQFHNETVALSNSSSLPQSQNVSSVLSQPSICKGNAIALTNINVNSPLAPHLLSYSTGLTTTPSLPKKTHQLPDLASPILPPVLQAKVYATQQRKEISSGQLENIKITAGENSNANAKADIQYDKGTTFSSSSLYHLAHLSIHGHTDCEKENDERKIMKKHSRVCIFCEVVEN